jgi:hypothetical protein
MSTIKTLEERVQHCADESYQGYVSPAEVDSYKEAEITELREALKVRWEEHAKCVKCLGEALQESTDMSVECAELQAKLYAIEAQEPVAVKMHYPHLERVPLSFTKINKIFEAYKDEPEHSKRYLIANAIEAEITKGQQ